MLISDNGAGGYTVLRLVSIVMLHSYCNADNGAGGYNAEVDELNDAAWLL